MSSDLYTPPIRSEDNGPVHKLYCSNRATLLEAMSEGGRHGFERPYFPAGCHYRWYSTAEICMILERFDAIIFIGDDTLKHIYAAFNMLLRENLAIGGLKQWEMTETDRVLCRCENQLTRAECSAHILMDSQVVADNDPSSGHRSPYYCNRQCNSLALTDQRQANNHRHTSHVLPHQRLTSTRRSPQQIHLHPRPRPRCLQAHPSNQRPLTINLPFLGHSNLIHGRMGLSSRCLRSKRPIPMDWSQRCRPSQATRSDSESRQQCTLALHD